MFRLPEISGSVFNGFLATKEWKRILQIPNIYMARTALNALIVKALKENETELVLQLIESSVHHSHDLLPETIEKYLSFVAKQQISSFEYVEKILRYLEKAKRTIFEPVAETLINVLKQCNCEVKRIQMDSSYVSIQKYLVRK